MKSNAELKNYYSFNGSMRSSLLFILILTSCQSVYYVEYSPRENRITGKCERHGTEEIRYANQGDTLAKLPSYFYQKDSLNTAQGKREWYTPIFFRQQKTPYASYAHWLGEVQPLGFIDYGGKSYFVSRIYSNSILGTRYIIQQANGKILAFWLLSIHPGEVGSCSASLMDVQLPVSVRTYADPFRKEDRLKRRMERIYAYYSTMYERKIKKKCLE